jgi:hypothetical protein
MVENQLFIMKFKKNTCNGIDYRCHYNNNNFSDGLEERVSLFIPSLWLNDHVDNDGYRIYRRIRTKEKKERNYNFFEELQKMMYFYEWCRPH